jgi:hypothetical protein
MRRWIAHALLLTIWIGLVGFITWLDLHNAFLLFAQPNPLLIFPTYLIALVVLVGFPFLPLLLFWRRGLPHMLRIPLVLGIVWLLVLPYLPLTTEQALIRDASRISMGMTEAQVRATMAGYRPGIMSNYPSGRLGPLPVQGITICADDPLCETTANVDFDFTSGRVVRVWFDLD